MNNLELADDNDNDERVLNENQMAILENRGKVSILRDAFHDESSVLCQYCSGLIPKARLSNHLEFWCDAL